MQLASSMMSKNTLWKQQKWTLDMDCQKGTENFEKELQQVLNNVGRITSNI